MDGPAMIVFCAEKLVSPTESEIEKVTLRQTGSEGSMEQQKGGSCIHRPRRKLFRTPSSRKLICVVTQRRRPHTSTVQTYGEAVMPEKMRRGLAEVLLPARRSRKVSSERAAAGDNRTTTKQLTLYIECIWRLPARKRDLYDTIGRKIDQTIPFVPKIAAANRRGATAYLRRGALQIANTPGMNQDHIK